jgi:hypothetical protein
MRKTLVSLAWIIFLNVVLMEAFAQYSVNFNPTITRQEAYMWGENVGAPFFIVSAVVVIFLAVTNRLPGAKKRETSGDV